MRASLCLSAVLLAAGCGKNGDTPGGTAGRALPKITVPCENRIEAIHLDRAFWTILEGQYVSPHPLEGQRVAVGMAANLSYFTDDGDYRPAIVWGPEIGPKGYGRPSLVVRLASSRGYEKGPPPGEVVWAEGVLRGLVSLDAHSWAKPWIHTDGLPFLPARTLILIDSAHLIAEPD